MFFYLSDIWTFVSDVFVLFITILNTLLSHSFFATHFTNFYVSDFQVQSNLCATTILDTTNLWPLTTVGRCKEVDVYATGCARNRGLHKQWYWTANFTSSLLWLCQNHLSSIHQKFKAQAMLAHVTDKADCFIHNKILISYTICYSLLQLWGRRSLAHSV